MKFETYLHSVILSGKSADSLECGVAAVGGELSDKVEELVGLEEELESAVVDLSCGCDSGRTESLSVFQVEAFTVFGKGVCTLETLSFYCSVKCVVFVECEAECALL